jgi:hypothetical protein
MPPTLEDHAPRTRCYSCGSTEIASLCHHCGKAMCGEHSPTVADPAGKSVSREFSGLGLDGKQAGAYHCDEHAHIVKGGLKALIAVGIGVAVVGVVMTLANLIVGLALLVAGAGLAAGGYRAHQHRIAAALAARPPFPVIPNLDSVSVLETLHGQVRLDEGGEYTTMPDPVIVKGQVDVVMTLARSDRDRLESYRRHYRLTDGDPIAFSAGFAMIEGEAGLTLASQPEHGVTPLPGGTGASFRGDVAGHPLFSAANGRSSDQWTAHIPYDLQAARAPESIPIWLVPSLVPGSDKRTLEVDVHWVALGDDQRQLVLDRFEEIELVVPKSWENVERVTPTAVISDRENELSRTIRWKQQTPERDKNGRISQSLTLAIRFEEQINKQDDRQDDKLTGKLRASFKGTLSGIKDVAIYRPLSGKWQELPKPSIKTDPTASVKTEVSVDFELSLRSIRYQDVRVVPDRNKDTSRAEVDEFPGVIPDYLTVIELTNEMSNSGFYVKRVTENQPGGGGRAELVNRVWDIAGRRYDGVFPIDFHITLTGEEEYRESIRGNAGNTSARITVWGSYVDSGMERQIEGVWDTLHGKVIDKMKERAASAPAYGQQYAMNPSAPPVRPVDDGRADTLHKRLESATEALLAGRISEEIYRGVKADIEAELGNI